MSSSQKHTLESVQQQFQDWRLHKTHPREKVPESLWKQAEALIGSYSRTRIAKTLGLNQEIFKRRLSQRTILNAAPSSELDFVEIDLKSVSSFRFSSCQQVELERADGTQMRLYASADHPFDARCLIQTFLEENHATSNRTK